jgi:hypothetical protein
VVGEEICAFAVPWICACERAKFQILTSSSAPSKKPCAVVPFERMDEASAAGWMLADCTGCPTARVPSICPSRYRFHVVPS